MCTQPVQLWQVRMVSLGGGAECQVELMLIPHRTADSHQLSPPGQCDRLACLAPHSERGPPGGQHLQGQPFLLCSSMPEGFGVTFCSVRQSSRLTCKIHLCPEDSVVLVLIGRSPCHRQASAPWCAGGVIHPDGSHPT